MDKNNNTILRYRLITTFFLFLATVFIISPPLEAKKRDKSDIEWNSIDRIGLDKKDNRLFTPVSNIWEDYNQDDAVQMLSVLPNRLTSSSYRELARTLLLSKSRQAKKDISAPKLLRARLEKLIAYGLFEDARALYDKAKSKLSDSDVSGDLSIIEIQLLLTKEKLASVCLDAQVLISQFPQLNQLEELAQFCRIRFSGDKKDISQKSFKSFPELVHLLRKKTIDIRDLRSNFVTLVAFSDRSVSDKSYNEAAITAQKLSDLTIKLALDEHYSHNQTYQCYAIEASRRGIITKDDLEKIYKNTRFSPSILNIINNIPQFHPCNVPAYFYQRLSQKDVIPDEFISQLFEASSAIPVNAMAPIIPKIQEKLSHRQSLWRKDIIAGANEIEISNTNKSFHPLTFLQKRKVIPIREYESWYNENKNVLFSETKTTDPALLHYISQSLSVSNLNSAIKMTQKEYEKLFSLTYGEKSLHLGLGFSDYIAHLDDQENHPRMISALLKIAGDKDIRDIAPRDVAVILWSLNAYKLNKKAVALAFEYLQ